MWLQGASDFDGVTDHHVRARVNGAYVGETTWDGKKPKALELELEPGVLREGLNTLDLEDVGDTGAAYSMVLLNRFTVSYPRGLRARAGRSGDGSRTRAMRTSRVWAARASCSTRRGRRSG